jgi:hypothetical protein
MARQGRAPLECTPANAGPASQAVRASQVCKLFWHSALCVSECAYYSRLCVAHLHGQPGQDTSMLFSEHMSNSREIERHS